MAQDPGQIISQQPKPMQGTRQNQQSGAAPAPKPADKLSTQDPMRWGIIAIVLVFVIIFALVYFQGQKASKVAAPTPGVPIISIAPTATATLAPTSTLETTETPIPEIKPRQILKCGKVDADITFEQDMEVRDSCFVIAKQGVTIDCAGHNIISKSTNETTAIYSEFGNTKIRNCGFDGFQIGVRLVKADDSSVESSTFTNNIGAILLEQLSGARVENNVLVNNTQVGIYIASSKNSKLAGNFIDSSIKYGIQMITSDSNTVSNNQLFHHNFGLQVSQSKNNLFTGNNVSFNSAGIKITSGSTGNIFRNNTVYATNGFGILLTDFSNDNVFEKNFLFENEYGLNIRDSKVIITDNYICDNTIEDVECNMPQVNASGTTCYLRAITCGFDCAKRCPNAKIT